MMNEIRLLCLRLCHWRITILVCIKYSLVVGLAVGNILITMWAIIELQMETREDPDSL